MSLKKNNVTTFTNLFRPALVITKKNKTTEVWLMIKIFILPLLNSYLFHFKMFFLKYCAGHFRAWWSLPVSTFLLNFYNQFIKSLILKYISQKL